MTIYTNFIPPPLISNLNIPISGRLDEECPKCKCVKVYKETNSTLKLWRLVKQHNVP